MKKIALLSTLAYLVGAPAFAAHANPWADETDTVQQQYHEANQAKSVDTPGEDEMKGEMAQNVSSNAGGGASNSGVGNGASNGGAADGGAGNGAGNGGAGNGGAGNGGGNGGAGNGGPGR